MTALIETNEFVISNRDHVNEHGMICVYDPANGSTAHFYFGAPHLRDREMGDVLNTNMNADDLEKAKRLIRDAGLITRTEETTMTPLERNLAALPSTCYGTLNTTGELILLKAGEKGYWPTEGYTINDTVPTYDALADLLNEQRGVTKAQRMAMEMGSMFGFDIPGAHPSVYEGAAA
jgi:hypothetical protein